MPKSVPSQRRPLPTALKKQFAPAIVSFDESSVRPGEVVFMSGTSFGSERGTGYLEVGYGGQTFGGPGQTPIDIYLWEDTLIVFYVPPFAVYPVNAAATVTVTSASSLQSAPASLALEWEALQMPQALHVCITGPSPLDADNWYSVDTFIAPQQAVSSSNLEFSIGLEFRDDSDTVGYDGTGSYVAGNHGHYEVKLQRLVRGMDGQGNTWQDVGPAAVADLYGTGAGPAYVGVAPNAAEGQSTSTVVNVPVDLPEVASTLRFAYRFFLGDTRANGSSFCSSVQFDGQDPWETTVPDPYVGWVTTDSFELVVLPSGFLQCNVIPVGLIYVPPGSKSSESFEYKESLATTLTLSDSASNTYSYAVEVGGKEQVKRSAAPGLNFSLAGLSINLELVEEDQTTSSWDTTTSQVQSVADEESRAFSVAVEGRTTFGPVSEVTAQPGDTGSSRQSPFWSDTLLLLVRPQFAVWEYPSLFATQLVSAWQRYEPVTVAELNQAVTSGIPVGLGAGPELCELTVAECAQLLTLDQFYVAQWQGATLTGPRWRSLGAVRFGTQIAGDVTTHLPTTVEETVASEDTETRSQTLKYETSIQSKFSLETDQTSGFKYSLSYKASESTAQAAADAAGGGAAGGSGGSSGPTGGPSLSGGSSTTLTTTSGETTTNALTVTYATKASTTVKSQLAVTGTLDDAPPPGQQAWNFLQVEACRDLSFGGIAFVDRSAPKPVPMIRPKSLPPTVPEGDLARRGPVVARPDESQGPRPSRSRAVAAPAAPPAAAGTAPARPRAAGPALADQLVQVAQLRKDGLLSKEEFAVVKAKLIP